MTSLLTFLVLSIGDLSPRSAGAAAPIAVVVHRANPIGNLSLEQLRRIFLGSTTQFENQVRVLLLDYAPDRGRFYRSAVGMSEDRVRRHWISLVFAGDISSPPAQYRDAAELFKTVASEPGAIGFVSIGPVPNNVKVVAIDGRRPGEPGYPLP